MKRKTKIYLGLLGTSVLTLAVGLLYRRGKIRKENKENYFHNVIHMWTNAEEKSIRVGIDSIDQISELSKVFDADFSEVRDYLETELSSSGWAELIIDFNKKEKVGD